MKSMSDRFSHCSFFENRNWAEVARYWARAIRGGMTPLQDNSSVYGITNLQTLKACYNIEQQTTRGDLRYERRTFALRVGYCGSVFVGFQAQSKDSAIQTVQGDLERTLGRKIVAAGRTDKVDSCYHLNCLLQLLFPLIGVFLVRTFQQYLKLFHSIHGTQ